MIYDADDIELAWCAGFFDGEGHIRCDFGKRKRGNGLGSPSLVIRITQTNKEPLERFKFAFEVGSVQGPFSLKKYNKLWSDQWQYVAYGQEAADVFKDLYPYLCSIKREQGDIAIKKWEENKKRKGLKHGDISMYNHKDCRCDVCCEGWRIYQKERRERKKRLTSGISSLG